MLNITTYIPEGKENAVTREQLCSLTGLSDRSVRQLIENARMEGVLIINAQDGKGYFRSNDVKDIRRQLNANNKRAMSILRQQKFLRRRLSELDGQVTMEVVT